MFIMQSFARPPRSRGWHNVILAVLVSVPALLPAKVASSEEAEPDASAATFEATGMIRDGIYALDDALDFDDLQAVAFDPQNGSLVFLGQQRKPARRLPIPYLDHLATALDADHPTFSLPWTAESNRQADVVLRAARSNNAVLWDRIVANARRRLFSDDNRLTKDGLRILQALNFPTDDYESYLTNKFDVMAKVFELSGGDQQAVVVGAYARSLRDPDELNAAIRELAMSRALEASETDPGSAETWEIFLQRFAGVFDADERKPVEVFRQARARGDHIVLARNAAVESILAGQDPLFARTFSTALELRAATHPHIYLPPDLVRSLAEIDIQVVPTWNRLDPASRMAQLMLESDMLLKWIVSDPRPLGQTLPGHQTEFAWNRERARSDTVTAMNNVRYWISPGEVQLSESADGNVLEIRKFTMRVNTNDPAMKAYAAQLTSLYEQFAERFPVLQELREAAKTAAAAQWLKRKVPRLRLPQEGRLRWTPPSAVPGFVSVSATVDVRRRDTSSETRVSAKWKGELSLEGGISLEFGQATRADGSVLFDGARGPAENLGTVTVVPADGAGAVRFDDIRKAIVPQIYDNEALKAVARQHTFPPPPMPPGATGKAELGKRKLEYVSVLQSRLGNKANAVAVQQDLVTATRLAKSLQFNDNMLNGLQAGRIRSMEAFQQAEDWARDERRQFLFDLYDAFSGGMSTLLSYDEALQFRTFMAEYIDPKDRTARHYALLVNEYATKAKSLLSDIDTARDSIGKDDKFDLQMATASRGLEFTSELTKALEVIRDTPVTKRAFGYGGMILDGAKLAKTILEINENRHAIELLGEQQGNEAQYIARLQKRRAADLLALQQVLQRLQQAVNK
jgi:hypothetical protein